MVIHGGARLACGVALALGLAGSTCKVVNEDHCANQDVPGNEYCRELNSATPYCSPCRRTYHGCVDFEPFACAGYGRELDEDDGSSSGDEASSGETSDSDDDGSAGTG